jgi:hypothetical protein
MARRGCLLGVAIMAFLLSLAWGPPTARAVGTPQSTMVNVVPAAWTPNIKNGAVKAMAQVGSKLIVGGTFTSVSPAKSSTTYSRNYIFAIDAATGAIDTGFVPSVDRVVYALLPAPDGVSVYVGGGFTTVNGVASKSLARLNVSTGAAVAGFRAPGMNGVVNDLNLSGGRLYLGGTFTLVGGAAHGGLASVNPSTGAVDGFMNLQVSGHHNCGVVDGAVCGAVGVKKFDIAPDGSRMVADGNFTKVSGYSRDQIVMILLGGSSAVVDPNWATLGYTKPCFFRRYDSYVRGLQFSPDGSYFVVISTGGYYAGSFQLCDVAARWETNAIGSDVQPTWADYTGTDSLFSVAVTGTAVYVGGHQRWLNNPYGQDNPGAGAVPRPGLAALDPATGVPLSWNPGRNPRGIGAEALLATPEGLWVGSDTNYIGNYTYFRPKIAFFPLAGGKTLPPGDIGQLPGYLYLLGHAADDVEQRSYDGTVVGPTTILPNSGTAWSQARGAFMVDGTLYYGWSDGYLYRRSFDGATFGPAALIDPYDDPYWSNVQTGSGQTYRGALPRFYSQIPNVTGMFFAGGKLYYTMAGGRQGLYYRTFSPESGIVNHPELTADVNPLWASAGNMFLSGSELYYVSRADGKLHRVAFVDGHPVDSTSVFVSGPSIDCNDWRGRALFLYAS